MATREHAPAGVPTWIDLMSADTDRARAFYGELFGWECQEPNPDFGGYANFTKDGVMVAGLMGKMEESLPDMWSVYLEVDDADASVAALTGAGGQVFAGPHPVGDLGVMVVAADSSGALIGMWQSKEHTGFGIHNETNAPAWFELLTPDYDGRARLLPEGVRLDPADRGRHAGVPLLGAAAGRAPVRRDHGHRPPFPRAPRRGGGSTSRSPRPTTPRRRSSSSAAPSPRSRSTPPTAASSAAPTRWAPSST